MHLELVFKHVKYVIAGGRRQRWKDGTLCSAAGWSSRCVCEWCIWILAASCIHLPHHKVLAFICWTLHAGTVLNCNQEDSECLNKENCIACKAFEHIVPKVYVQIGMVRFDACFCPGQVLISVQQCVIHKLIMSVVLQVVMMANWLLQYWIARSHIETGLVLKYGSAFITMLAAKNILHKFFPCAEWADSCARNPEPKEAICCNCCRCQVWHKNWAIKCNVQESGQAHSWWPNIQHLPLCQIWCQDSRCGGKASSQYELQVHFDISLRVSWQRCSWSHFVY